LSRAEKNIIWFSFFPRSLWALQIGFFLIDPPANVCVSIVWKCRFIYHCH
jgi:hypothetical protein